MKLDDPTMVPPKFVTQMIRDPSCVPTVNPFTSVVGKDQTEDSGYLRLLKFNRLTYLPNCASKLSRILALQESCTSAVK